MSGWLGQVKCEHCGEWCSEAEAMGLTYTFTGQIVFVAYQTAHHIDVCGSCAQDMIGWLPPVLDAAVRDLYHQKAQQIMAGRV